MRLVRLVHSPHSLHDCELNYAQYENLAAGARLYQCRVASEEAPVSPSSSKLLYFATSILEMSYVKLLHMQKNVFDNK